jgi:hypothetical protein
VIQFAGDLNLTALEFDQALAIANPTPLPSMFDVTVPQIGFKYYPIWCFPDLAVSKFGKRITRSGIKR